MNRLMLPTTMLKNFSNLREELRVLPGWPDGDGGVVAARAEDAFGALLRVGVGDAGDGQVGLGLLCE